MALTMIRDRKENHARLFQYRFGKQGHQAASSEIIIQALFRNEEPHASITQMGR